ncbi:MAG: glycosyltransferase, partial [Candidatus Aenigmarchaeota archaeon]|nr:glycosyltransferase [Candidatus Aenigmarchaeota archaeon]
SKKKGIWWGRNYGAKFAKGKYLVFVDADTALKRRYLEEIRHYLDNGYVGISAGFGLTGNDQKTRVLEELVNYYWIANSKVRRKPLIGFNVAVPRTAFDKIGGFKKKNVEDEQLNSDLAEVGEILFLKKRLVVTSTRRLDDYGFFGICRYYLDLILVDNRLVKGNPYGRFLKHKKYKPAGRL